MTETPDTPETQPEPPEQVTAAGRTWTRAEDGDMSPIGFELAVKHAEAPAGEGE